MSGAWALVTFPDELVLAFGNLNRKAPGGREWNVGLIEAIDRWHSYVLNAVVEANSTRHFVSRGRVLKTGKSGGMVQGVLQARGIKFKTVAAEAWKPGLGVPSAPTYWLRKKSARRFAHEQFPGVKFPRHDHAEAALLALWYIRNVMKAPGAAVRSEARTL